MFLGKFRLQLTLSLNLHGSMVHWTKNRLHQWNCWISTWNKTYDLRQEINGLGWKAKKNGSQLLRYVVGYKPVCNNVISWTRTRCSRIPSSAIDHVTWLPTNYCNWMCQNRRLRNKSPNSTVSHWKISKSTVMHSKWGFGNRKIIHPTSTAALL